MLKVYVLELQWYMVY